MFGKANRDKESKGMGTTVKRKRAQPSEKREDDETKRIPTSILYALTYVFR